MLRRIQKLLSIMQPTLYLVYLVMVIGLFWPNRFVQMLNAADFLLLFGIRLSVLITTLLILYRSRYKIEQFYHQHSLDNIRHYYLFVALSFPAPIHTCHYLYPHKAY